MANPNDIARILNEMVNTLQDLSKKELDSVEKIISEQKKLLENDKKIKDSKKVLNEIKKEVRKQDEKIEREEKKQIGLKKNLLSSLIVSGKKLSKSNFKIPGDKSTSIKDMLNKVSFKFVEMKSKIQTVSKKSQSLLDFERKTDETDIQQQQLDVLKEIDKKLINLSFNGSGSWLDSLFEGVGNLVSGILGGALGVGRIGGLAGLGGLFKGKLGGLAKVGKVGLKVAKNPIALGAVGVGLAGTVAYNYFNKDEDKTEEIEPRQKGGPTKFGKTYLVGEDGPEIFTPKQNGFIIPNNKLNKKESIRDDSMENVLGEFKKSIVKNISKLIYKFDLSFKNIDTSFGNKISEIYDNVKNWVSEYFSALKDKASNIYDGVKKTISNVFDNVKNWVSEYFSALKDKASNIYDGVKKTISNVFDNVKNLVKPIEVKKEPIDNKVFNFNPNQQGLDKFNPNQVQLPDINIKSEPVEIQSQFSVKPIIQIENANEFDKKFWTDEFVPAFKNSLRVKKPDIKTRYSYSSDPFG